LKCTTIIENKTMNNVTIFKDFKDKTPVIVSVASVAKAIRTPSPHVVQLIHDLRAAASDEEKREIKKSLPCILFAGEFSERKDTALTTRSGYAVFDFDKLPDNSVQSYIEKVKLLDYVLMAFVSPSGNGIKVVVNIGDKHPHREVYSVCLSAVGAYLGVPEESIDHTSINESRICFASHDPMLYFNESADVFRYTPKPKVITTDYNKINIAVNMIRLSNDGEKHAVLLKAARLMGGYISSGAVDETMAVQILEQEIRNKPNVSDIKSALQTIQDGIKNGKMQPLYETEEQEGHAIVHQMKARMYSHNRRYEFLTDKDDDYRDLLKYRRGGFKMGLTTGHKGLDKHFLFKEGEFNVVLGHANVGKSYFMWWLMVQSARLHGWRWIVYSTENKIRQQKKKLMEYKLYKKIEYFSDVEFEESVKWLDEYFAFIRIDKTYNAIEILDYARILCSEKEYKGFCIDPYNSLSVDVNLWQSVKGNRHEYDYAISSSFVSFADKMNVSIFLNAHAATEALRKKHPGGHPFAGHPMPPEAADIEGGGKFVNRVTGSFIVIHRYIYHEDEWKFTRVEVKKVKDAETGGIPTKYEEPVEFLMDNEMCLFKERLIHREDTVVELVPDAIDTFKWEENLDDVF